jgi:hypothetical protein
MPAGLSLCFLFMAYLTLWHTIFITHGAPINTNFLGENGSFVHLYFIHAN